MLNKINRNKELATKFLIVGGAGFLCNYLVLKISYFFLPISIIDDIIAATVALQLTFFLHDRWTYSGKTVANYQKSLRKRYFIYMGSNSFGSIMTVGLFAVFSQMMNHLPALALAALIAMVWNFLMNKLIIWRHEDQPTKQ